MVCPICENTRNKQANFYNNFAAPARRALESLKIKRLEDLCLYSQKEIMDLHGIGPSVMKKMIALMRENKLKFKSSL